MIHVILCCFFYVTSHNMTSHLILHLISCHQISYNFTSCFSCCMSYHIISDFVMAHGFHVQYHNRCLVVSHVMSCYIKCHITIISCHITPVISVISYQTRYQVRYHVMCHITPGWITSFH